MSLPAVSHEHAARWAERARLDLEASADRGEAGLSKIRTAITEGHDAALGYRSLGDYLSAEYADALGNVCRVFGVEFRRQVVNELASAGLSTRAIAPVMGVSKDTVQRDMVAGVSRETPEPTVDTETGEVSDDYPSAEGNTAGVGGAAVTPPTTGRVETPPAPRPVVTGIDGKTYTRPEPSKPRRNPLPEQARTAGWDLDKAIERLQRIAADDRFTANKEAVAPHLRSHLTNAIEVCQDLLERINN